MWGWCPSCMHTRDLCRPEPTEGHSSSRVAGLWEFEYATRGLRLSMACLLGWSQVIYGMLAWLVDWVCGVPSVACATLRLAVETHMY